MWEILRMSHLLLKTIRFCYRSHGRKFHAQNLHLWTFPCSWSRGGLRQPRKWANLRSVISDLQNDILGSALINRITIFWQRIYWVAYISGKGVFRNTPAMGRPEGENPIAGSGAILDWRFFLFSNRT